MMTKRNVWVVGVTLALALIMATSVDAAPRKGGGKVRLDKTTSEGDYSGVTMNGGQPPETKPPPSGLQHVTWPGFRWSREGSEVFLQLTGQVTYQQKVKGHRVLITLDKTLVPLRNNLRTVITSNFGGTPVSKFRLRLLKNDRVRLEISLRRKATPTVSMSTQGQYSMLVVAFSRVEVKGAALSRKRHKGKAKAATDAIEAE
jgi:hypothetical protein